MKNFKNTICPEYSETALLFIINKSDGLYEFNRNFNSEQYLLYFKNNLFEGEKIKYFKIKN